MSYSPIKYARLRVNTLDGPKRVLLEVTSETDKLLKGWKVDQHGERIGTETIRGHYWVVAQSDITHRINLRQNNIYGDLETVTNG